MLLVVLESSKLKNLPVVTYVRIQRKSAQIYRSVPI